jgi:hypothetical protein
MNREEARTTLGRLVATVREETEDQAAVRFLERIAATQDPEALRDALVEVGAATILRAAR